MHSQISVPRFVSQVSFQLITPQGSDPLSHAPTHVPPRDSHIALQLLPAVLAENLQVFAVSSQ